MFIGICGCEGEFEGIDAGWLAVFVVFAALGGDVAGAEAGNGAFGDMVVLFICCWGRRDDAVAVGKSPMFPVAFIC